MEHTCDIISLALRAKHGVSKIDILDLTLQPTNFDIRALESRTVAQAGRLGLDKDITARVFSYKVLESIE